MVFTENQRVQDKQEGSSMQHFAQFLLDLIFFANFFAQCLISFLWQFLFTYFPKNYE